jgi:hypothetical protein
MTMNWSQQEYDCMTLTEREAEQYLRVCPKSLIPKPTPQIERSSTNRVEADSLPAARYAQWKRWFVGWDVMLAALAGVMIFFILSVASIGVLGSALTVAGIMATVGLGHYLLWGRVFARTAARERQQVQERGARSETRKPEPPDEFSLGLNDRERGVLLQLLEHSLPAPTEVREESGDRAAIRRGLQEKVHMFGA